MKRLNLFLCCAALFAVGAQADVAIGNQQYAADTLFRRVVGPGMTTTIVRLPDYPLNIYVTETDLNNPHNRVETTLGYGTLGRTERLLDAMQRNRTATRRPIVACNGNFWCVSSEIPPAYFELGTPYCSVIRNDSIYVNAETNADNWCYGPTHTGGTAISRDKTLYFDLIIPSATIASAKWTNPIPFTTVNRRCLMDAITLWTPAYGRTRQFEDNWVTYMEKGEAHADNYYLTLKPGSRWGINTDMTFVVAHILPDADRQALGSYDACFTATGNQKAAMAQLAVGDEITIHYSMAVGWGDGVTPQYPEIENMIEGLALVMQNDTLTYRNYDDSYNTKTYSRTCYGASADGKHLSMMVIDMSTSKKYGSSAGCSTETACRILKSLCPDVTNIVTMDAGGSAMMAVGDQIISTTTEGNPRAVACGWMVEAVGEEDNEVASIAFDDWRVQAPVYSSYTPRMLGYNRNGELVSEDVRGFTLTCDPALGLTEGDTFIASGNPATGTLTATLGGMTASVQVTTLAAQPAIRVKPTLLIDDRDYPVEVTATLGQHTYFYDPARLQWTIDDPAVATITNGTLRGVANGSTQLHCLIGELEDSVEVRVEISDTPYQYQPWTGWTLKGSGASNLTLTEDGTLSFDYSGGRAPYVQMNKEFSFYGLPDTIGLTFVSSLPVDYIQTDLRNQLITKAHYVKYGEDTGYEAGQQYTVLLDLDEMGGVDQVSTYPLTLHSIKFSTSKTAEHGAQTIQLKSFYAHYPPHPHGVLGDVTGDGQVDISDVNAVINIMLGKLSSTPAADVTGDGQVDIADVNAVINLMLGKGVRVVSFQ